MARRLRVEPYDPNAVDGDGDGIVQENTAWERPVGTRLIDEFGDEIRQGLMSMQRPSRMRVVDASGNDVRYIPTYATQAERQVAQSVLGALGRPSLAESGAQPIETLADRGIKPISERVADIDAIVNPQTITPPDVDELPLPTPGIYPKMEKSSPTARLLDAYSPEHSALPMFDTLLGIPGGEDSLRDFWDSSGIDYLEYETGVRLTFEEFLEIVRAKTSGTPYPTLTAKDGTVINDNPLLLRNFNFRIDESMTYAVERDTTARHLLKDFVSTQIGSKMADMPMSKESLDTAFRLSSIASGSRLFADVYHWDHMRGEEFHMSSGFPAMAAFGFWPDDSGISESFISGSDLREYVLWGLGGEKPLWLDSPELNPDVKAVFSLPPTIYHSEGMLSTAAPRFTIGTFMPINEVDPPEVVEAKLAVQQILSRYSASTEAFLGQDLFEKVFARYGSRRSELVKNEISEDIMGLVLDRLIKEKGYDYFDTSEGLRIRELLDYSTKGYNVDSLENRLLIFSASRYCDDETRSLIIDRLGFDFTKQDGWPKLVEELKTTDDLKINGLDFDLVLIDPFSGGGYVKRDGSSLDKGGAFGVSFLDEDIALLVDFATNYQTYETSDAVKEFQKFVKKKTPKDKASLEEKDEWMKLVFEKFTATIPGYTDQTAIEFRLSELRKSSAVSELTPEKAGLLQEQPTLDFHRYLASRYVSSWAESSNGSNPLSYLIQETTQELFGLEDDSIVGFDDIYKASVSGKPRDFIRQEIDELKSAEGELVKSFVLAQYENTQEFYKSRGITSIPVARGMTLPSDHPYVQELVSKYGDWPPGDLNPPSIEASVLHRPLSSFATFLPATRQFARGQDSTDAPNPSSYGVLLVSQVPVHQIFGNPYTGNGCLNEYEVVVIGGGLNGKVYLTKSLEELSAFDLRGSYQFRLKLQQEALKGTT